VSHVPFPLGIRDDTAIVIIEIYFPGHQFQNWRIWRPPSGKRASRPTQPYSAICLDPPPGELAEPITLRDKLACVWKQLMAAPSQISVAVDLRSMTK